MGDSTRVDTMKLWGPLWLVTLAQLGLAPIAAAGVLRDEALARHGRLIELQTAGACSQGPSSKSWKMASMDGKGNDVLTEEVVIVIEWFEEAS